MSYFALKFNICNYLATMFRTTQIQGFSQIKFLFF
jgi:hypothetical protein